MQDTEKVGNNQNNTKKGWQFKGFAIVPARVYAHPKVTASAMQVYCAIVNYAASNGQQFATLTNANISDGLGVSVSQIKRALKWLSDIGELTVVVDKHAGGTYRQVFIKSPYPIKNTGGGASVTHGGASVTHEGGASVTHQKEKKQKEKKPLAGKPANPPQDAKFLLETKVDSVLMLCQNYWGVKYKQVEGEGLGGNSNRKNIRARLKDGATGEQVAVVIQAKGEEWRDCDKMSKHLKPKTVFSKSHFSEYFEDICNETIKILDGAGARGAFKDCDKITMDESTQYLIPNDATKANIFAIKIALTRAHGFDEVYDALRAHALNPNFNK